MSLILWWLNLEIKKIVQDLDLDLAGILKSKLFSKNSQSKIFPKWFNFAEKKLDKVGASDAKINLDIIGSNLEKWKLPEQIWMLGHHAAR